MPITVSKILWRPYWCQ